MSIPFFTQEIPSTSQALQKCLGDAVAALSTHGWAIGHSKFTLWLCLEEALVNAVRRGNNANPERKVRVTISEEKDERCRIVIHDEGQGFDPELISMPDCEHLGGRGVCLIKHYMESVEYDKATHNLELIFRRNKNEEGESDHGCEQTAYDSL